VRNECRDHFSHVKPIMSLKFYTTVVQESCPDTKIPYYHL
jgi:hypothetical protein